MKDELGSTVERLAAAAGLLEQAVERLAQRQSSFAENAEISCAERFVSRYKVSVRSSGVRAVTATSDSINCNPCFCNCRSCTISGRMGPAE